MSDRSDDDLVERRVRKASDEAAAAARRITSLSDDESDDGQPRLPVARRYSPPSDDATGSPHDSTHPRDREEDGAKDDDNPAESPSEEDRDVSPPPVDSYDREADAQAEVPQTADILHFPPDISFSMAATTSFDDVPPEQNPILYRLKSDIANPDSKTAVKKLARAIKSNPDPFSMSELVESNANIITWSDGSQTLAIGEQQFLLIKDKLASNHYLFRRGNKIQTLDSEVASVMRAQPASTEAAGAKLAMVTAAMKASAHRPKVRTMLRCMNDGGEQEEERAKLESARRERERARIQAKRRQARERHIRPVSNRGLTVDVLESNDEDSGDDNMRRLEERVGESRLMRAKRAPPPVRQGISVKRRKVGAGRRVVASDDDDDGDDEDSD